MVEDKGDKKYKINVEDQKAAEDKEFGLILAGEETIWMYMIISLFAISMLSI